MLTLLILHFPIRGWRDIFASLKIIFLQIYTFTMSYAMVIWYLSESDQQNQFGIPGGQSPWAHALHAWSVFHHDYNKFR